MAEDKKFGGRPKDIATKISDEVPGNLQQAFVKVVTAGEKFMFSEKTHKFMLDTLRSEGDLGEKVGEAMAGLLLVLFEQSNQKMPLEVMPSAGVYLIGKGGEFLERVTGEDITPDVSAKAIEVMFMTLGEKFGLPPDQLMMIAEKSANGEYA